jgi:hypothetical protein
MKDKMKRLAEKIANPGDLVKANIYSNPIKNIGKVMQIEIAKKIAGKPKKMEMGGEVMDMTKAQPVGMMDGGKVKKMNMGGVIGGRGGKFKGMM